MNFTLQRGKRYKTTITLGFVERLASNDAIADKFRTAGFTDVKVTGEGGRRYAEGIWNADDMRANYPPQISDVSEVVA
ncbi:hypothetical protein [Hyphomicrobium sp.]|uniref:hypothetical protein n=1 Tax=Hyphomicrobium sp. TaxID=82 RepID=UPI002E33C3B6|nr:hypothetical protein [Hyphomicrobium sp.]HEX2842738.1 hypothetical protein [Hyphomicrobium sp.]